MLLKEVLDLFELLDTPAACGETAKQLLLENGADEVTVTTIEGAKGSTDCIKALIKGSNGKSSGGTAPTLGIIGRLGGLGARPAMIGFVSDGDGALAALAAGLKIAKMHRNGDVLEGDVIVATHICPDAPTQEHFPVPFMGSPISMVQCNMAEVDERMDAILSIDTTKGNRVINLNGIAISNTVKEGYILEVSNDLTGSIDGKGTMEPATDVFPLSNNYNPLPYYLEPYESPVEGDPGYDPAYPYTLTQGRIPFFHHGTVRNAPWNRELCPVPETWINPETAAEIGIEDGDWLWLESKRGRTQGLARVTKSVAPKVIYQERYWFPELLDSDDPNRAWQAMNINLLTQNNDECPFNDVYGTYVLRGVQINITKADSAPEGVWTDPTDFTPWLPEPSENTGGGNAVYGA